MAEAKKVQSTNVIISLSENEARRLKSLLFDFTDFLEEIWASELYEKLEELDIEDLEVPYYGSGYESEDDEDEIEDFDDDRCGCPACCGLYFGFGGDTDGAE